RIGQHDLYPVRSCCRVHRQGPREKHGRLMISKLDILLWLHAEVRFRAKLANRIMGKQGQTIANLRGELARVREEHSKLARGERPRLQRFEEMAKEQFALDHARLKNSRKEIVRLR